LRDTPIDALRQTLAGHPFGEEVSERIASSYADGVSFGEAFRRLLQGLLGKYGLLFLDPLSPGIRSLAAPFLARALGQSRELVRMVRERTGELERAGYHGQVHLEPNSTFFFSLENGKRVALKKTDEGFNHLPLDQLTAHAERLSPNALLRPVMQDYLLPTIAYLGGPAELAYLAQSEPLYRTLLGRMPVATHRASFTLLDARAAKLMRRHSLELRHVTVPEVTLRETIAGRLIPHDLSTRFDNARQSISAQMEALAGPILAFDPSIGKALKKAQAKVAYQVEKLQAKVARERFRRDERAAADASYLHTSLYPHRHLQERFFGLAPFLARHGMDLVDRVHDVIKPECPDHQILILD
jgi:bacillithiol biosynthesis cysteine-adding enzyme BshC